MHAHGSDALRVFALIAAVATGIDGARAQADDPNVARNPYHMLTAWRPQLPPGRTLGQPIGVEIDHSDGKSLWVFERCGSKSGPNDPPPCAGSKLAPIWKFDSSGAAKVNFGAGIVNWLHGFYVDSSGNVWVTDIYAGGGIGQTVIEFAPDGKVLMTLGKPGVTGSDPGMFNQPSDVVVSKNGDIYVADGHGHRTNDRIVKFDKNGKFIATWAKHGSEPGELDTPHSIALDSIGRVFVADRVNNRIEIFDPSGRLLELWKQFGRPSSVYIDKSDTLYVGDSQSTAKTNPGFRQGIRIGSAKDGKVTAFIPLIDPALGAPEEVAADDDGNVYAGFTDEEPAVKKFVKN
jgi:sugar lactone lactonase YvrE